MAVLALSACASSTSEVLINTVVEDLENGTFSATGDLFGCEGRWGTLEIHLNQGDTWWFESDYECDDGSGVLMIRTEGQGAEPDIGESVGTWNVVSGTGSYEGITGNGSYDLEITPWTEVFRGELTSR